MGRRRRRGGRGHAVGALPEAIAALSQTLPAGPSPEIFRRAKFDRPEAVRPRGRGAGARADAGRRPAPLNAALWFPQAPALWRLLFRVLSPPAAAGTRASPALGKPRLPIRPAHSPRVHLLAEAPPQLVPPPQ